MARPQIKKVFTGKMREHLKHIPSDYIDSCITDPPYALTSDPSSDGPASGGFLGLEWDKELPQVADWKEAYRVLKPGAHLLAFAGTRTYHHMALRIEQAGFEIRDMMEWIYWSGFPKGLNVGKAIDKHLGVVRPVVGKDCSWGKAGATPVATYGEWDITAPGSPEAKLWEGWSTQLKPAHEPIVVARKPFPKRLVDNVLQNGTGPMNVDACRIPLPAGEHVIAGPNLPGVVASNFGWTDQPTEKQLAARQESVDNCNARGRWPANVISEEQIFGDDTRFVSLMQWARKSQADYLKLDKYEKYVLSGLAPVPKPARREREAGCENLEAKVVSQLGRPEANDVLGQRWTKVARNTHPTVKPVTLMRWLVRLFTPKGGIVLDPYGGSGTTSVAAILEGDGFVTCELMPEHVKIIWARVMWAIEQMRVAA